MIADKKYLQKVQIAPKDKGTVSLSIQYKNNFCALRRRFVKQVYS
jgi:hypothetical protein